MRQGLRLAFTASVPKTQGAVSFRLWNLRGGCPSLTTSEHRHPYVVLSIPVDIRLLPFKGQSDARFRWLCDKGSWRLQPRRLKGRDKSGNEGGAAM